MEGRSSPRRAAAIRATLRQAVEGSDTLSLDSPIDRAVLLRRLERALEIPDPLAEARDAAAGDSGNEEGPGSWRFEQERRDRGEDDREDDR